MSIAMRMTASVDATLEFLRDLAGRIGDVREPLGAGGRVMLRSISENFEAEGRPLAWKPHASATLFGRLGGTPLVTKRGREKAGARQRLERHKILQDRGFLKVGIKYVVEGNTLRIGPSGPAAVYGRIQQLGGQAGRGRAVTIPPRPYLLFQDEDLVEIAELIRIYIEWER